MKVIEGIHALAAMAAGAGGVALSAAAAHGGGANAGIAAQFLLFHAPVFLLLASGAAARAALPGLALVLGLALFAGDLLARDFLGHKLFPLAAPTGGMLMIAGWLLAGGAMLIPIADGRK